jgi:uncharacterized membrane protein YfcA
MDHLLALFGLVALGFCAGAFGTLIGAGGGFVLVPLLLLLYPHDPPETLTAISLAVVFFNALSGTAAYARAQRIDYRSALLFSAATVPGAVLGALNTALVPRRTFDLVCGLAILAAAGLVPLARSARSRRSAGPDRAVPSRHLTARRLTDARGTVHEYTFDARIGLAASFAVGYVSSFLGIGGGIVHVPFLIAVLHFPVHVATATSHFILAVMSLTGSLAHVFGGSFAHGGAHRTLALAVGVVLGAQLGAHLSEHTAGGRIITLLAAALATLGLRLLFQALGW